ncbi:FecR family protein [Dinghuibacter silviterrae]|uniref:FecR family protein n=1 Tax=Dinghuibacter silviterrae TaxID=1539049 RepID=A0A4R8DET4_9BACT|nr:FecR family protein [Dinghuibacter silviterrae]TDW96083.1 FecR family protein [Dinghuibacter silviterrae]
MQTEKEDQEYLRQHPELRNLQEEFEQADGETPLPEGYSEDMLKAITARTQPGAAQPGATQPGGAQTAQPAGSRVRAIRITLSAAAAVLLLAGVGLLLKQTRQKSPVTALAAKTVRWLQRTNGGSQPDTWTMPDGSTAILYPHATIQYREDFGRYSKREVRVTGRAFFEVVKNPDAPFVAYTDKIRTVVLGTAFKVINDSAAGDIRVELYTGKVRVCLPDSDVDLQPGQELTWARETQRVWVDNFNRKHGRTKLLEGQTGTLANWFMFNNQNLGTVFDQMAAIYGTDIQYDDHAIHNIFFIGMLDKRDSLNKILNDLATLNHLTVTHRDGKYIIAGSR